MSYKSRTHRINLDFTASRSLDKMNPILKEIEDNSWS